MTADARDRWITVGVHAFGNLSSSWSVNCACMQRDNEKMDAINVKKTSTRSRCL